LIFRYIIDAISVFAYYFRLFRFRHISFSLLSG